MNANLRPQLAQHLRQRLNAFREGFPHNLALIGPPGSGKTFQLRELARDPPEGLSLIYCPLFHESCRSFLRRFLGAIAQPGLQDLAAVGDGPPMAGSDEPLERLLCRADERLPRTAQALRASLPLIGKRFYGEAFTRALDAVPVLAEERGRPCVLILDEFLSLEDFGLSHAFHELGKRVMTGRSTLFILSSSAVQRARMILRERLQLLFGQFELISLEALDPALATAWLQQELRGMRLARAVGPFLVRWLGAYPWYLTVFAQRLRDLASLRRAAPWSADSLFLQAAWDVLGSADGTLHQWCASRTDRLVRGRQGARALETLTHIAEGTRTATEIGSRLGRTGISDALQVLADEDLARRSGSCWLVHDPVLRVWLSTILSMQRADARVEPAGARQRFESELRSLWARWLQSHELSFPEQVVALFSKFEDDIVSLDLKTGRLPRFETIKTHQPDPLAGTYLIADAPGRRWCAAIGASPLDENAIAGFERFCRAQTPRPSRKVVVLSSALDENARLLAKSANMWVWAPEELQGLMQLYGRF